jgi:two-component system, cell cycle sensor histidine kinase and response regulator CckA
VNSGPIPENFISKTSASRAKKEPELPPPSNPRLRMKIIHLEDNALDAELTAHNFRKEWPECEIKLVDTRQEFIDAFSIQPDLILSDFSLVGFNGIEALALARERLPDTPFIFLSGTIGEERALEALRGGASDYVIKDRPGRLIPSIRRVLEENKLQRERHETEARMLRAQRMENIGMLAAGIAHDFNNVLSPVLMGVPLLRSSLTSESDQMILTGIERCAARGAGLARQILEFGRGTNAEPQLIEPKHLVHEIIAFVTQTFPKSIRIEENTNPNLWGIRVNPTQLHQVLLNLCVNARDAMPNGGTLSLSISNKELNDRDAAVIPNARPGSYVLFEVSDTGTGIPPEVLQRMWDPFFTTKELSKGTGLGLATVKEIIVEHRGSVVVRTQPGKGTRFQILLPAETDDTWADASSIYVSAPCGNNELILVVDDDVDVREITRATLVNHGYRVLTAADGVQALAIFTPRRLEFHVLVTDLDMPNLDGAGLAKVVHTLNPAVHILTVSGSSDTEDIKRRVLVGDFLPKPCSGDSLLSKVHELLNGK